MADAPARFKDLCLDATDHQALADWWCGAMGYVRRDEVAPPEEGWTRPLDWPVPIDFQNLVCAIVHNRVT